MSSARTYQDAIDHLNSLQSNAATLEAVRASGGRLSESAIPEMLEYLERIGYSPSDLNALNVIHITGTKGKGSTSAFVNSILQHSKPPWKVGLYTSPHLVAVRERIRINGAPISEEDFAKYFFEIWDKLVKNDKRKLPSTSLMPGYFRFMTLLAFHTFLKMKVDATVLEVGVGGAYDSTNIVPNPVVTGITALGIDHVSVLGKTLKEIAWQKGGIFKEDVPALTVAQPQEGMEVLEARAKELKASSFNVVQISEALSKIPLGLAGKHQVQNAAIAVELARGFLRECHALDDTTHLPQTFIDGLKATKWPGRCQIVSDPVSNNLTWYLDGAHTTESLNCCMDWFLSAGVGVDLEQTHPLAKRILVFNCTRGRSGQTFLAAINDKIAAWAKRSGSKPDEFFDRVIFCTNVTYADGHFKGDLTTKAILDEELAQLTTQTQLATAWTLTAPAFPRENIHVLPSIEHAINQIKKITVDHIPLKILVAGSLHLVGGVIEVAGLSQVAL
ncbi:Folylpolyglutamate synthase [Leucoagaricus sp. SymC.cos]|nr:Folylpolyglutamate synthase [Leucoagaricus sp. SymC.cos]